MTKVTSLAALRTEIPLMEKLLYADTATQGLVYRSLLEWRRGHDQALYEGGEAWESHSRGLTSSTREAVASFFGGDPAAVALTPNFSIGLNFLAESLNNKMAVLQLESDYPSVNWPFESRGFECTRVPCDEKMEDRIESVLASAKIDILALSLVQWVNGIRIRPAFLSELKKQYPDLLVIADGTQYCGAFALDFPASGIDVLGASGYKWLLSGYGNAFFLFNMKAAPYFNPRVTGFNASGGNLERQYSLRFPRQLEPGHLDTLNFGSLKYSLGVLAQIGMAAIERHNSLLCGQLRTGLAEMELLEDAVIKRPVHGTIYNLRGDKALYSYLRGHGVVCAMRGRGIRLSLHCYNTPEDVNAIVKLLQNYPNSLPAVK